MREATQSTLPALSQQRPHPHAQPLATRRPGLAGLAGGALVAAFAVLAAFGPLLAPYRATAIAGPPLDPPSTAHPLGTTLIGQDVLSQLVLGARSSLTVAAVAGLGTVLVGGVVGVTAGWFSSWLGAVLMRVTDLVLVLPKLPLLLLVGALTGGQDLTVSLLIALTFWPTTARILRSQVLTLRTRTHVRAATGFGAGTWHQLRRHILPDLALLGVAELVPAAGRAVALQAGLAFLGVGDPVQPSWGSMIRDAVGYPSLFITSGWIWWLLPPIVAVMALVIGISLVGTAVEGRLSPRLSRHQG